MKRFFAFCVAVALSWLIAAQAHAAASCTQYVVAGTGSSPSQASWSRAVAAENWCSEYGGCYGICGNITETGGVNGVGTVSYRQTPGSCPSAASRSFATAGTGPCQEDPCDYLGSFQPDVITRGATSLPSGELCLSDDGQGNDVSGGGLYGKGCKVEKAGAGIESPNGHWFGQLRYTGVSCGEAAPTMPSDTGANCVTTAKGQICISKDKSGCGTFNGDRVCLPDVPPGKCVLLSGGGAVCESSAGSPPAPDNGSGSPAEPDGEVEHVPPASPGTTNVYNYYGPTTVTNSSTPVVGAAPGTASGYPGAEDSDGSAGAPDGYGDTPSEIADCVADMDACATQQATGAFEQLVAGVPILAFASDLNEAFSAMPACPTVDITLFGETYNLMASACSLVEGNQALISLVFIIAWSFFALRVALKAE